MDREIDILIVQESPARALKLQCLLEKHAYSTAVVEDELLLSRIESTITNQKMKKTPAPDTDTEIIFRGKKYLINSNSMQALDFLSSTYENALQQKREVERVSRKLEKVTRELEENHRLMEKLSCFDRLTGMSNRRSFDDHLDREWRRSLRNRNKLSLLMIDIDHFKVFNDTYGHQAGDECLKEVATALKKVLKRGGDFIARYSGPKLAAILPRTGIDTAVLLAKNMGSNVEDLAIAHAGSSVSDHVTISVGAACVIPRRDLDASILVSVADEKLHRAKEEGRNRCKADRS